jgi:uncharacterized membrane-anchored protein YhcB (DUF1043 family)
VSLNIVIWAWTGLSGLVVGLVIGREVQVVIQRRKNAEWARFLNETRRQLAEANAALASARAEIHRLRGIGERHEEVRS